MSQVRAELANDISEKYARVSGDVNFHSMGQTSLFVVGTGASGALIESLGRLGTGAFYLFDLDRVEQKNIPTQNFTNADIGRFKTEALKDRLHACEFERGNDLLPALRVHTGGDFLALTDQELQQMIEGERRLGNRPIFVMASDSHPVQARGNRIALKFNVPVFFVGIYRGGVGGEIIIVDQEQCDKDVACYRCIAATRYSHWNETHLKNFIAGLPAAGVARSSGLPMAATLIDAIMGHLIVGAIHRRHSDNRHAQLYHEICEQGRTLVQMQLQPGALMGGDDIFGVLKHDGVMTFNTLFQKTPINVGCNDCERLHGKLKWHNTDYTTEHRSRLDELGSLVA